MTLQRELGRASRLVASAAVVIVGLAVGGCSASDESTSSPQPPVTVIGATPINGDDGLLSNGPPSSVIEEVVDWGDPDFDECFTRMQSRFPDAWFSAAARTESELPGVELEAPFVAPWVDCYGFATNGQVRVVLSGDGTTYLFTAAGPELSAVQDDSAALADIEWTLIDSIPPEP